MLAAPLVVMVGAWTPTLADEPLTLKKTIDVGGVGLGAFDISDVDPKIELYILADRTNASVDLFNSEDGTFIGRVGAACPVPAPSTHFCFQGVKATTSISGPDGVVIVDHKTIWAGDGDSRVKVIDIATKSFVTTISTGGKFRVDEMAYDPRDHILAVANNADSPPFVTLFDTKKHTILGQIIFDNKTGSTCPVTSGAQCVHAGVDATNGIEQPQWSPQTGMFYVSIPQVGSVLSVGGVSVINPKTMAVTRTLLVNNCTPGGLALGPKHEALVGCTSAFGTLLTTKSTIIDITSTSTAIDGAVVATVPIGGSDEVWYDKGTQHYFLAARNNRVVSGTTSTVTPILGSIDALSHKVDPSAPTSTTAHSVAADANSHLVFVPIGFVPPGSAAGTDPTNPCPLKGCIAVFRAHSEHSDDDHRDRDDRREADRDDREADRR
jgi:hypothetical protein